MRDVVMVFDNEGKIIDLLRQIVIGMDPVWDQRIVHRDLKPENLLITPERKVKIIDFGIARFLDRSSLTKTIAPMGPASPFYAAPEQLFNRKFEIDIRTDFFALGIIAAELHLGFHPYDPRYVGNAFSIPENIVSGFFISPSTGTGASPGFARLIRRLLQSEPYKRYRDHTLLKAYLDEHWRAET